MHGAKPLPECLRHGTRHRVMRRSRQGQQGQKAQDRNLATHRDSSAMIPPHACCFGAQCKPGAVGPARCSHHAYPLRLRSSGMHYTVVWSHFPSRQAIPLGSEMLYIPPVITLRQLPLLLGLLLLAGPTFGACADPPAPGVVWRQCLLDNADFLGRDLTGATLRDTFFARARFVDAKLNGVDASDARFSFADMTRADLTGTTLRPTDLNRAVLAGATLKGVDLRRATLFRADLRGADLTGAELTGANLSGADLSGARWLDGEKIYGTNAIGSCQ